MAGFLFFFYNDAQILSDETLNIYYVYISLKNWLSELVHLTCYRICARGLSATIHYHNKSVTVQCVQMLFHNL